ncbi:hypothetical protein L6452_41708 [Arctium lappa]|uniref:Uncharacterized protein n=1 Tax=Arctium lappa TaxID=4217 RepID=A0ACB8XPZ2_ARCLA|nr:hypothetical protein L6452_41708 [Arctium lappa]
MYNIHFTVYKSASWDLELIIILKYYKMHHPQITTSVFVEVAPCKANTFSEAEDLSAQKKSFIYSGVHGNPRRCDRWKTNILKTFHGKNSKQKSTLMKNKVIKEDQAKKETRSGPESESSTKIKKAENNEAKETGSGSGPQSSSTTQFHQSSDDDQSKQTKNNEMKIKKPEKEEEENERPLPHQQVPQPDDFSTEALEQL